MYKKMHPVSVATTTSNDIEITQEWNDINEQDPVITLNKDQVGQVATWLLEAMQEAGGMPVEQPIPYMEHGNGIGSEEKEMEIYNSPNGMIIIDLGDNNRLEISPSMAKRMRDQLSKAVSTAFTDFLKSDSEV